MFLNRALSRGSCFLEKNVLNNLIISKTNLNINKIRFFSSSEVVFSERFFTKKHEWVSVDGKIGTVGISNYAQEALGDVVYIQLPEINTVLKKKDECGALESVKAASEIYCPVSGKVVDKNKEVENTPSLINKSCYDKGWLFKLELENAEELKELMTEDKYNEFLKEENDH